MTVDTFPASCCGHVEEISPATGAQFALLPPDDATGNYTKVVQRISCEDRAPPDPAVTEAPAAYMSINPLDANDTKNKG